MNEALYQPIDLLTDLCGQLAQKEVAFTGANVESAFAQIQGAAKAVIELATNELASATAAWSRGAEVADTELMPSDQQAAFQKLGDELERSKTEIQACLQMAHDTVFSSSTLQEFQSRSGYLTLVQAKMETSLRRLDSAMLMSKHPDQVGRRPKPATAEIENALTNTAEALQHLSDYMRDGSLDSIDYAVASLDKARVPLHRIVQARRLSHFADV